MPELKHSFAEGELVGDNYRILSVAGTGGMGVVYRALDLRLERIVALKFLPSDLNASQRDRDRFLREARTASSLDHPNIGVIHGVEQTPDDGLTFIVMAFYEGASLGQRLARGPLPPHEAVDIATQMARGLAEAHSRGIIHRDVKPSNVMLTGTGLVKIVDFGLAFVATAATASQTGTTGTVAYMSPEQAMGRSVDQRSDIWSLGVVLAEMLTGQSPFSGDNIAGIMYAILNEAPRGLDDVHPALQPILYRALAKDPERRYLSCAELLAALEQAQERLPADTPALAGTPQPGAKTPKSKTSSRPSTELRRAREAASRSTWGPARRSRAPLWIAVVALCVLVVAGALAWFVPALRMRLFTPSEKHIAVLPFDNIGSNPENDALAAGLMESLSGRLSNLDVGNQSLWIVPTSEVRYRHITDPADALKQLGANLVIKGAVERDGNNIHLTVNLIDTKNLRQLGSVDVEDPAGDLSTLEDETVARLARLMDLQVTSDMLRNTGGRVNPAAYQGYLTALGYMQRYDKPGNLDLAISTLQNAVKTDPGFALGYGELGEAWRLKNVTDPNPKWLAEAEANAEKAVQLDNSLAPVYVTLGHIHHSMGQHDLALEEFQHAYSLDAHNAQALAGMAHVDEDAGKLADAEAAWRKAADLEPTNWDGYDSLGNFYRRHGKYAQAFPEFQRALQIAPDNAQVLLNLGGAYADSGDPALAPKAEEVLKKSIGLRPGYAAWANLGLVYLREKRFQDAAGAFRQALQFNASDFNVWEDLRVACEWLNDQSGAQEAASKEEPLLANWIKTHPRDAAPIADFAELLSRYGSRAQAEQYVRTALALAPNDPSILECVAATDENLGKRHDAVGFMNQAFAKGLTWDLATQDPETQQLLKDPAIHPPKK